MAAFLVFILVILGTVGVATLVGYYALYAKRQVVAIIVGILAVVIGGSSLMWAGFADFPVKLLFGWLPIFVGSGVAIYAYRKDEQAPFPIAVKILVGALLLGIAAVVILFLLLIIGPSIH